MPILDQAVTINMAPSRNGCVTPRVLCEILSKNQSFRKAGIAYTRRQIGDYRACGINGIYLYAHNP